MTSVDPLRSEDDPQMPILRLLLRLLTGRRARKEPSRDDIERAAAAQVLTIDDIVARPQAVDVFDERFKRIAADDGAEMERRLQDGLSARSIADQVAICRALAAVAPAAALTHLIDIIVNPEIDAQSNRASFHQMWRAMFDADRAKLEFDRQKAFQALKTVAGKQQSHERKQISNMLALLNLPEASDLLRSFLADSDIDVRANAAYALANTGDAAGWPVLQEVLTSDAPQYKRERHQAILALTPLAELPDQLLREQVLTLATSQIERLLAHPDNEAANEVMNLLHPIEMGPPASAAALLERIANSKMIPWIRDLAFQKQLTLGGAAALPAIAKSLNDKTHLTAALNALMELGPAAASPEIVQGVGNLFDECKPGRDADLAYRALVSLGCAGHEAIARNRDKLTPWFAFAASARSRGLDGGDLLALLRRIELIDDERVAAVGEERCRSILTPQSNELDLLGGVLELLHEAKALHAFDTENDRVPPDYVSLMEALARLAAPRFLIGSVSLQPSATYQGHRVMFLFDGKPSSLAVRDMGDWFDVSGVVGHLNELIADRGRPERFAALYSGDQISYLVFGHGERMIEAKRDVGFPLAEDPDTPMKVGQAYEQQVISEIERGN